MKKNTIGIRIFPDDRDVLRDLCTKRWENRAKTKEKKIPSPSKVIRLALRQPNLKKALAELPALEDLR